MDRQADHVTYWLDRDDRIVKVGGAWDRFALDNDGPAARADAVVGRPIWDFVVGDASRMWLESLLGYARLHDATITRRYRCDSPDVRRYLSMTVVREGRHHLRVEHLVESVEPRERIVGIAAASNRAAGTRLRCSICGRIKGDDAWREPEDAALADRPDAPRSEFTVIYSVCAECQTLLPQASTRPVDRLRG